MKKIKYSWKQFDKDVEKLAKQIQKEYNPATIVAMARGGLILGVKLSHILHKPLMIMSAKTYSDKNNRLDKTVILNTSYTVPLQSPVLICDEISDTGITLKIVIEHFKSMAIELKTCTLLYKTRSCVKPDFYCREIQNDKWVVFAWE